MEKKPICMSISLLPLSLVFLVLKNVQRKYMESNTSSYFYFTKKYLNELTQYNYSLYYIYGDMT